MPRRNWSPQVRKPKIDDSFKTHMKMDGRMQAVIRFPQHGTSPWQRFWEEHCKEERNRKKWDRMGNYV